MSYTSFNLTQSAVSVYSEYISGDAGLCGKFTTNGGKLLVYFGGSGSANSNHLPVGANLLFNGEVVASAQSNPVGSSRRPFMPVMVSHVPKSKLTNFAIDLLPGTRADVNDVFSLTVMEIQG